LGKKIEVGRGEGAPALTNRGKKKRIAVGDLGERGVQLKIVGVVFVKKSKSLKGTGKGPEQKNWRLRQKERERGSGHS